MLKKSIIKLVRKYGLWRIVQVILSGTAVILILVAALTFLLPLNTAAIAANTASGPNIPQNQALRDVAEQGSVDIDSLVRSMRTGLFKSASAVRDNPMADKTIERIRSQLKLQCVMDMNGQKVAYIKIKNVGLRKGVVGETVEDMFTVVDIQEKRVELNGKLNRYRIYLANTPTIQRQIVDGQCSTIVQQHATSRESRHNGRNTCALHSISRRRHH